MSKQHDPILDSVSDTNSSLGQNNNVDNRKRLHLDGYYIYMHIGTKIYLFTSTV